MSLPTSLRKAAVLLSSLDDAAADAILGLMPSEDAAKVRSALMELSDIPAEEQQQVLTDFLRQQSPPRDDDSAGVELLLDPAVERQAFQTVPKTPLGVVPDEGAAFAFLEDISPPAIAGVLQNEHPQTAAVVVSQLPPAQAAAVLQELPANFAIDALERIATIDAISTDVLAEVARALRRQLAPHARAAKAGPASLAHLTAVLQAMDYRQRQRLLLQLGERNTSLLNCLGLFPAAVTTEAEPRQTAAPRYRLDTVRRAPIQISEMTTEPAEGPSDVAWLTFEDFLKLDDAALRAVFAAADPELSLLALTGAEPRLIARILRRLPAKSAATLRQRLEHPGAVRLRDIEQARDALAAVANRLAHEGTIDVPASRRFAAAI
jgi:flagellar motor switch protein FliG